MAVVAAFGDVDVAAYELKRGVGDLEALLGVRGFVHEQRWDDLHHPADGDGEEDEHGEGQVVFQQAVEVVRPRFAVLSEKRNRLGDEDEGDGEGGLVRMVREQEPEDHEHDGEHRIDDGILAQGLAEGHGVLLGFFKNLDFHGVVGRLAGAGGHENVKCAEEEADEVEGAAGRAEDIEDVDLLQGLYELVFQGGSAGVGFREHEALHDAGDPHR